MSISLDEVRHVARLARLDLSDNEILSFQGELNALIGHFADIQGIDVSGISPQTHAVALSNVWADDVVWDSLPRDMALRSAPVTKAGLFLVPAIIED